MNKVTIYRYDENKPMRTLNLKRRTVVRSAGMLCEVLRVGQQPHGCRPSGRG